MLFFEPTVVFPEGIVLLGFSPFDDEADFGSQF